MKITKKSRKFHLFQSIDIEKFLSWDHLLFFSSSDTTQLILKAVMHELDYDLDSDDLQYLDEFNTEQKSRHERLFTEEEFENALIILEYYAAEQIRLHLKQKSCDDENIVCDICLLPDADDGNEMVFCERCNACVHQNCYGIVNIPTGTWLCKPCSIVRRPACLLCPKFGGPMKCTPSGTVWCHLTCALWLPELKFGDYIKMVCIFGIDRLKMRTNFVVFLFRNRFFIWIKFHMLDGHYVVLFVQVLKVPVFNVHIKIVEHLFMFVVENKTF